MCQFIHVVRCDYLCLIFFFAVCVLYGFCGAMFGLLSINTIAAVSLDRYLVITRTTGVSRSKNPRQTYCMLLIAWFNSLIWSIPPLLGWNRYALEGFQTSCSFDYLTPTRNYRSLVVSMCLCGFVIPLFIIIFCYAYIYNTVHTHECTFRATSKRLEAKVILGGRERLYSTELRMVKTAMLVLLFYLISWMPYAVVSLMGVFGYSHYLKPLSSVIPGIMAKMSSIYNPFIYTISHHRFRKKLRMLFSRNSDIRHLSSSLSIEMGRIFNDSNDTDTSPSQVFTRSPTVRGHYRATSSQDAKHLRGSCRTAFNRRSKSPRKSINRKSEYRAVSQISESENNNHAPKPNQTQTNDYKAIVIPSFVSPVKKSPLKLSKTVSNWFGPYEAISLSILPGSPEHRCAPLRRSHSDDTGFRTQPLDLGNPDEKEPLTRDLPTPKVPKSLTIVIDFRHLDPKTSTVV